MSNAYDLNLMKLLSNMRSEDGVIQAPCSFFIDLAAVCVHVVCVSIYDECTFYKYKWLRMLEHGTPLLYCSHSRLL